MSKSEYDRMILMKQVMERPVVIGPGFDMRATVRTANQFNAIVLICEPHTTVRSLKHLIDRMKAEPIPVIRERGDMPHIADNKPFYMNLKKYRR